MKKLIVLAAFSVLAWAGTAAAQTVTVTMHAVNEDGEGPILGTILFEDSAQGLRITPNLAGLGEGQHGFHVHEKPACGPAAKDGKVVPGLAAGGHFDPKKAGKHEGPDGKGHLGDLPVLYVDAAGNATRTGVAPNLKTSDLEGRSVVIHAGGDNYSDSPSALGGGGARAACGVVGY